MQKKDPLRIFTMVAAASRPNSLDDSFQMSRSDPANATQEGANDAIFGRISLDDSKSGGAAVASLSRAREILLKPMVTRPGIIRPANISSKRLLGVETTDQFSLITDAIETIFNH
jgi:hypothetical protein